MKYSPLYLILGFLFLIGIVSSLGLNVSESIKRPYGEMWNYTSAGWNFDVDTAGVYYNLTGLGPSDLKGFTFVGATGANGGSHLVAQVAGRYAVEFHMSFSSQAQGGLYGVSIAHDYNPNTHRECYARRTASLGTSNLGITCIMTLKVGDRVAVMIENELNTRDISIETVNLNLHMLD